MARLWSGGCSGVSGPVDAGCVDRDAAVGMWAQVVFVGALIRPSCSSCLRQASTWGCGSQPSSSPSGRGHVGAVWDWLYDAVCQQGVGELGGGARRWRVAEYCQQALFYAERCAAEYARGHLRFVLLRNRYR